MPRSIGYSASSGVEDRALRDWTVDRERQLPIDARHDLEDWAAERRGSFQRLDLDRDDRRQVADDRVPGIAGVVRGVDLPTRRAEVDAAGVELVDGHRVAQDVDVAVLLREPIGHANLTSRPTVFMQKHWDVMRTDNCGDLWHEVSGNLPTDFGFPIGVHAHEPETIYVVPIKSDSEHFPPDGKLALSQPQRRERMGGSDQWAPAGGLLRQRPARLDGRRKLHSCGIYFGTTGGQVYASNDAGDTWNAIVRDLPSVVSVEVQTLK